MLASVVAVSLWLAKYTGASCSGVPTPCSRKLTPEACKAAGCGCSVGGRSFSSCDCTAKETDWCEWCKPTYDTNCPRDHWHKGDFECYGRKQYQCDYKVEYNDHGFYSDLNKGPARNSQTCHAAGCHWCDASVIHDRCNETKCDSQDEEKISESFFSAIELVTSSQLGEFHMPLCDSLESSLHDYLRSQIQQTWPGYKMVEDILQLPSGPRYQGTVKHWFPESYKTEVYAKENSTVLGFCYGTCGCLGPHIKDALASSTDPNSELLVKQTQEPAAHSANTPPSYVPVSISPSISTPPSSNMPVKSPSGGITFWQLPDGTRSKSKRSIRPFKSEDIISVLNDSANNTFLEDLSKESYGPWHNASSARFYSSWENADSCKLRWTWTTKCKGDVLWIFPVSEHEEMYCTTPRPTTQPTTTHSPSLVPTFSSAPTVSPYPSTSLPTSNPVADYVYPSTAPSHTVPSNLQLYFLGSIIYGVVHIVHAV